MMMFDLKAPWTIRPPEGLGYSFQIHDADGVFRALVPNTEAGRPDPALVQAGQDLAAPTAALIRASPILLQAAMLVLVAARRATPAEADETDGTSTVVAIPMTDINRLRSAIGEALMPVAVVAPPAAARPALSLVK